MTEQAEKRKPWDVKFKIGTEEAKVKGAVSLTQGPLGEDQDSEAKNDRGQMGGEKW